MSLLVARMITPLIAAYFLRSHGVQPHAAWKWMDVYLKVLNWSLDTTKATRCCRCRSRAMRLLRPVLLSSCARSRGTGASRARQSVPGDQLRARSWSARRAYGAAKLIASSQAVAVRRMPLVRIVAVACRLQDHRLRWSAQGRTLLLSVVLFGTCRVVLPAAEHDYSRSTSRCRREHAEADRSGVDRVAAIVEGSERRARVRARQRRQRPRQHRAQEGPRR